MEHLHTTPIFRCRDQVLLNRFYRRYRIESDADTSTVIEQCSRAFSCIPYENLTKIIKSDGILSPESALRFPEEVLADHLKWGAGGTCFSLTAAMIAVFNTLGIEAHPLLADRHYGTDTHCGLIVMNRRKAYLIDPGYLMFVPTPLPIVSVATIPLGYTTIELVPHSGGNRIDLATTVKGNRKVRLTYKRSPVDATAFRKAWTDSFTWEMMTYPVLTRCTAGEHLYLQGASAAVRSSERTVRSKLDPMEQISFIVKNMGIDREVVLRAWKVTGYGTT